MKRVSASEMVGSISYSARRIFSIDELTMLRRAEQLVRRVPESMKDVRCHELARACGFHLNLQHQDGYYGFVDHSWLWTRPLNRTVGRSVTTFGRIGFPNILDVYCVGQMPMVRLVDGQHTSLPHIGWAYRPGEERQDVDDDTLERLIRIMGSKK